MLLEGLSIVASVAGLVLWSAGLPVLRRAAFPVFYLTLMVLLPRPIVNSVTLHLQLFAAGFAGQALDLFGIPFYLNRALIVLPQMALDVAEVCNGSRLMALVMLTLAFAPVTPSEAQSRRPPRSLRPAARPERISVHAPRRRSRLLHAGFGPS